MHQSKRTTTGLTNLSDILMLTQMVTLVGGAGCVTLCVSAVLSVLAVALPTSQLRHRVATTIGHAQIVSGLKKTFFFPTSWPIFIAPVSKQ